MRTESSDAPSIPLPPLARLTRQHNPGWQVLRVEAPRVTELHVTLTPAAGKPPETHFVAVAELLRHAHATVVRAHAFGSLAAAGTVLASLRNTLRDPELPVAWIEGAACDDRPLAGLQLHAIAGATVTQHGQGDTHARVWDDGAARHCVLGHLGPASFGASRPAQARETLERLRTGLAEAGMTPHHLARTWFFLDEILDWYGDFNRVRNDWFAGVELRPGRAPASTGVGGRNATGAALALTAWAIQPHKTDAETVQWLPSPKQCPAPAYGSAFSRAVEFGDDSCRRVLVSGTASIEPGGRTAHAGDVDAQIALTMDVVEAILIARGMSFADLCRATAYYRRAADAPRFADWLRRNELESLPVVHTVCDICRDDLLFELEADAAQSGC